MEGDGDWRHVSGVPGLGCSVENYYRSPSMLKLWEEENDDNKNERKDKITLSEKIVKFFTLRRKKKEQQTVSPSKYSSVSLPKVSVRRSASAVTASSRTRANNRSSDKNSDNITISRSKSNISRSVSLHREKKGCLTEHKKLTNIQSCENKLSSVQSDQRSVHSSSSRQLNPVKSKVSPSEVVFTKSQTTQTESLEKEAKASEEDDDYDSVYSDFISPAMLITLSAKLEENTEDEEDEDENLYEEINIKDNKPNPLFLSISQGRRNQLEMYRFAGWDLEKKMSKVVVKDRVNKVDTVKKFDMVDKDNYIKQHSMKAELRKKLLNRNVSISENQRKEAKRVTFANHGEYGVMQRIQGMNCSPDSDNRNRLLHSNL